MTVTPIKSHEEFTTIVSRAISRRLVFNTDPLIKQSALSDQLGQSRHHRLLGCVVWPVQIHLACLRAALEWQ